MLRKLQQYLPTWDVYATVPCPLDISETLGSDSGVAKEIAL